MQNTNNLNNINMNNNQINNNNVKNVNNNDQNKENEFSNQSKTIDNSEKEQKRIKNEKKEQNLNEERAEEEEGINNNNPNELNNQIIDLPEIGINISNIVTDSKGNFATFCSELHNKGIDLNKINFSKEPLTFWNCLKAFFLTLFDGTTVNCGFWNRMCLRVFFENAKSNGASYHFVAFNKLKDQFPNSNRPNEKQYEKNIKCLIQLLKEAQAQEKAKIASINDNRSDLKDK